MKPMWHARVVEVVVTNLLLRGDGTTQNPYRRVTQYWSKDGELLAEADPVGLPPSVTEQILGTNERTARD